MPDALLAAESDAARATPVWIVWWEEPERSWEAVCLSAADAEAELASRHGDSQLARWGKVGVQEPRSLLQWFEGHARKPGLVAAVRDLLTRAGAGQGGRIVVRAD